MTPKRHNALSYGVAAAVFPAVVLLSEGPAGGYVRLVTGLWCFHFLRRTAEALWVHRYSGRPVQVADFLVEYAYYWGFATWIALGVSGAGTRSLSDPVLWAGIALFVLGEAGNTWAHQKLRALRSSPLQSAAAGQSERKLPDGGLFSLVACPHYLFEITSWLGFALVSRVWGAWSFLALGTGILISYARARHLAYAQEFDGKEGRSLYPKARRALVPFVL